MIPWIIVAVVVVPLVVVAFSLTRRATRADLSAESAESQARTEREFADAEDYGAEWHEEDKARFQRERLP